MRLSCLMLYSFGKKLADEISMDDTKSENINSQCRPSVIREKYVNLTQQQATNLKAAIAIPLEEFAKLKLDYLDRLFCTIHMVWICILKYQHYLIQHGIESEVI